MMTILPKGAVPAYGLHHQIYVVWAFDQKLWFDKSLDGGLTWLPRDQQIMDQIGGWSLDVPGLGRANGMPVTCTDLSINQYRGSIYVCWADLKNGEDNMDVWIMHSRDEVVPGPSASKSIRIPVPGISFTLDERRSGHGIHIYVLRPSQSCRHPRRM
ncbi:MAG: hypothetical protein IPO25_17010 [Saprospiraceae bacterium]|nr:hypothetical protein [Saprospiraceae bacterium]